MRIGQLASRSSLSAKTIRYYEQVGLTRPPRRSPSGYRDYDDSAVDRLAFIRAAQALGLSLGEIRSIIALRDDGETPCGYVVDLLQSRSADIDRRIAQLRSLRKELDRLVQRAESLRPVDCDPRRVCHLIGPAERSGPAASDFDALNLLI